MMNALARVSYLLLYPVLQNSIIPTPASDSWTKVRHNFGGKPTNLALGTRSLMEGRNQSHHLSPGFLPIDHDETRFSLWFSSLFSFVRR